MLDKSGITLGVGDDAALFGDTLVCKDIMAEGIHFTKGAPVMHIMRKIVTANVSDIAAMGGTAELGLLGIAIPAGYDITAEDMVRPFEAYGVKLIGGDTTSSKDSLFISVTIIGKKNEHVLTRSGAKAGDIIYMSRPVGRVRELLDKELEAEKNRFIDSGTLSQNDTKSHPEQVEGSVTYNHYLVKAETELGDLLGRTGIATSCIDISDGLGKDASHISDMSGVKMVIESDRIPLDHLDNKDVMYAIGSGEEFALLYTINEKDVKELETISPKSIRVGRVEAGHGVFLEKDGKQTDISDSGYEHTF